MSSPRIVVPGATTAITRRTTLRKAFLAPWHPMVQDIWLYSLAYAQWKHDVAVHHTGLMPNHHHTTVTPSRDNLPEFNRTLHRDASCALNALLCESRYDAPRELFDDRQPHTMRLVDAEAQASHLIYENLNGVSAGLVQRPEHMPGRRIDFDLWKVGYLEVLRPPLYFGRWRPESLRLYFSPPPVLYDAFGGNLERLAYHMKRLTDDARSALVAVRTRPVMGARALTRLHPWSEPRTLRESGGRRVPTFRIGARGIVGTKQRIEAAVETHHFRESHRYARIARRDGDHSVVFPFGTYAQRVHHGANVEPEPPDGSVLAQPGPLMCEIQMGLDLAHAPSSSTTQAANDLIGEVRGALQDEALEIVRAAELDFERSSAATHVDDLDDSADPSKRRPAVVRHRFARRHDEDPEEAPSRIITLRDRRRGRPRRLDRHGADPPR